MAKIIRNTNGEFAHYHAGVIYDIGYIDQTTNTRIPFYVGETSNFEQRLKDHQRAGKNADATSTLVYQTIKEFNEAGITWTMEPVAEFGEEGPTDLEDEWIMRHLYNGHKLTNMKKGNANWMSEREAAAKDMRTRNISSYRKYREVITQEELDSKHAKWLRDEEEKKQLLISKTKAEIERKRILEETAKKQAEVILAKQLENQRAEERKAKELERWEADKPAREMRMRQREAKLKKEEQLREDQRRLRDAEDRLLENKKELEFQSRSNLNYSDWPEEQRAYHQKLEDQQVRIMRERGWSDKWIEQSLEVDRRMSWPPTRQFR